MSLLGLRLSRHISPIVAASLAQIWLGRVNLIDAFALVWFLFGGGYRLFFVSFSRHYSGLGLFYLTSLFLLLSDVVNQTEIATLLKGFGAYLIFPTTVLFLVGKFTANQLWIFNLVVMVLNIFFNKSDVIEQGFSQETFKFGFSYAAVFLVLQLVESFFGRAGLLSCSFLSTLAISLLGAWGNLRLLAFVATVSFGMIILFRFLPQFHLPQQKRSSVILATAVVFPSALIGLSLLYSSFSQILLYLIPLDLIDPDAALKTAQQSTGDLGILFGGRGEIFSAVLAWLDKPILGWGSWAKDPFAQYSIAGGNIMEQLNYTKDISWLDQFTTEQGSLLIPAHSVLWAALVWGGGLAFLPVYFFLIQFLQMVACAIRSKLVQPKYRYVFIACFSMWTLLFSPFGFSNRIQLAMMTAFTISWFQSVENEAALADQ
ncbi:MAG: hypothetical protein RLZZ609_1418 [Cyanobacteriota bacterium]|jgi:hypothetical protein